jgi:hypothetical protein
VQILQIQAQLLAPWETVLRRSVQLFTERSKSTRSGGQSLRRVHRLSRHQCSIGQDLYRFLETATGSSNSCTGLLDRGSGVEEPCTGFCRPCTAPDELCAGLSHTGTSLAEPCELGGDNNPSLQFAGERLDSSRNFRECDLSIEAVERMGYFNRAALCYQSGEA